MTEASAAVPPNPDGRAVPQLGLAEPIPFDDLVHVETLAAGLSDLSIGHVRLDISEADYRREGGPAWFDRLIPFLACRARLLPCLDATSANGVDFAADVLARYGRYFDDVALPVENGAMSALDIEAAAQRLRAAGKRVVLAGLDPLRTDRLRELAGQGLLAHADMLGLDAFPGTWTPEIASWDDVLSPLRAVLTEIGWQGGLWITGAGYATWRYDEARQLAEFRRLLRAGVERVYWYSFQDVAPARTAAPVDIRRFHTGLATGAGRLKLAGRLLAEGGTGRAEAVGRLLDGPRVEASRHRIVITGGCGFLGANLADRLASQGRDVLVLDNLSRPGVEDNLAWLKERHPQKVAMACVDLRDDTALPACLEKAEAVLHLAAQVAVTSSVTDPRHDFTVNALGTLNVLETLRQHNPKAPLIYASTNKVYGDFLPPSALRRDGDAWVPLDPALAEGVGESTPLDLYSPYGCSKGTAEQYVRDYARIYGMRTAVLRMSCIYGTRQFGTEDQGWVAHFLAQALMGEPITIYGDGCQVRDILYVSDAVDAWLACLEQIDTISGSIFNLGGGPRNAVSLRELLDLMREVCGLAPEVRAADWRPGDQYWYVSDTRRLAAATGWAPRVSIEEGLQRLSDWLENRLLATRPATSLEISA